MCLNFLMTADHEFDGWPLEDWMTGLDWAVFYVPANTYMGDGFLQVKRPNQQYQSTEGTYNTQITENTHITKTQQIP